MKKINNKGFLLVETLVVATFCLTVLVILFLQFKNLIISYNNSYKYNTVEGIYNLNIIKRYLNQNDFNLNADSSPYYVIITRENEIDQVVCTDTFNIVTGSESANNNYCDRVVETGGFKTIIFTNSNIDLLKGYLNNNSSDASISNGMRNFIEQINKYDNSKRLIAEFNNGTYATITY